MASAIFNPSKPHKLGSELCEEDQLEVLRTFDQRYTRDHIPAWVAKCTINGKLFPVQFASDMEWLSRTYFQVKADGRLDQECFNCQAFPTYPE